MPPQRVTPDDPPKREPCPPQRSMHAVRLDPIAAARRLKPAVPTHERTKRHLIGADRQYERDGSHPAKAPGRLTHVSPNPPQPFLPVPATASDIPTRSMAHAAAPKPQHPARVLQ